MIRVYLDTCCFNRPFDEQFLLKVRLETQAKLSIQQMVLEKRLELAWSFILEYENEQNPATERRLRISLWQSIAVIDCDLCDEVLAQSRFLTELGLDEKDAYHIACAIFAKCNFFITTDRKILNKAISSIRVVSPIEFVYLTEGSI